MAVLGVLPEGLACRPIVEADVPAAIDCLCRGFPGRQRQHWEDALARMAERPVIEGLPRYGYALADRDRIVGVMLTLYVRDSDEDGAAIRCNLSSWAVDVDFRSYAVKLIKTALARRDVTFLSVTPSPVTRKVTEALRFRRFAEGQQAFVPILSRARPGMRVVEAGPDTPELDLVPDRERTLLLEHAAYDCDTLLCLSDGAAYPFIFKARRVLKGRILCSQVIYCRSHEELGKCAGTLGRYLLRKGQIFSLVDANAPVPGLVGRYFADSGPKYYKGPNPPLPGDLAFTEFAVFNS